MHTIPGTAVIFERIERHNGERFETYVIEEKAHSGIVALYGPAARLGEVGDPLCIISYAFLDESEVPAAKPKIVLVHRENRTA